MFSELDGELAAVPVRGDVFIVGGAVMAVAYGARPATRDLDDDWLNDGVRGFLPGPDEGARRVVYEGDHLTVSAASPEYLLATKLFASRVARDEDDIKTLAGLCGIRTVEAGLDLVERFYGTRPIEPKVAFLLEELLARPDE